MLLQSPYTGMLDYYMLAWASVKENGQSSPALTPACSQLGPDATPIDAKLTESPRLCADQTSPANPESMPGNCLRSCNVAHLCDAVVPQGASAEPRQSVNDTEENAFTKRRGIVPQPGLDESQSFASPEHGVSLLTDTSETANEPSLIMRLPCASSSSLVSVIVDQVWCHLALDLKFALDHQQVLELACSTGCVDYNELMTMVLDQLCC